MTRDVVTFSPVYLQPLLFTEALGTKILGKNEFEASDPDDESAAIKLQRWMKEDVSVVPEASTVVHEVAHLALGVEDRGYKLPACQALRDGRQGESEEANDLRTGVLFVAPRGPFDSRENLETLRLKVTENITKKIDKTSKSCTTTGNTGLIYDKLKRKPEANLRVAKYHELEMFYRAAMRSKNQSGSKTCSVAENIPRDAQAYLQKIHQNGDVRVLMFKMKNNNVVHSWKINNMNIDLRGDVFCAKSEKFLTDGLMEHIPNLNEFPNIFENVSENPNMQSDAAASSGDEKQTIKLREKCIVSLSEIPTLVPMGDADSLSQYSYDALRHVSESCPTRALLHFSDLEKDEMNRSESRDIASNTDSIQESGPLMRFRVLRESLFKTLYERRVKRSRLNNIDHSDFQPPLKMSRVNEQHSASQTTEALNDDDTHESSSQKNDWLTEDKNTVVKFLRENEIAAVNAMKSIIKAAKKRFQRAEKVVESAQSFCFESRNHARISGDFEKWAKLSASEIHFNLCMDLMVSTKFEETFEFEIPEGFPNDIFGQDSRRRMLVQKNFKDLKVGDVIIGVDQRDDEGLYTDNGEIRMALKPGNISNVKKVVVRTGIDFEPTLKFPLF